MVPSILHPILQVREDRLSLVFVGSHHERFRQLAEQRDRNRVLRFEAHLSPSPLGLERPRHGALDAFLILRCRSR